MEEKLIALLWMEVEPRLEVIIPCFHPRGERVNVLPVSLFQFIGLRFWGVVHFNFA